MQGSTCCDLVQQALEATGLQAVPPMDHTVALHSDDGSGYLCGKFNTICRIRASGTSLPDAADQVAAEIIEDAAHIIPAQPALAHR